VHALGRKYLTVLVVLLVLFLSSLESSVVAQDGSSRSNHVFGSLSELQYGDRALLVVLRSGVVSADPADDNVLDLVLRADHEPRSSHRHVYAVIAKKLNSYIRKYKSLIPATQLSDADCVIFFNLVEYRRILNTSYPFGELYIILKGTPEKQKPPRVIWKSRKVLWAADAVNEFLRELRNVRGET
jgi:hypothetical protein